MHTLIEEIEKALSLMEIVPSEAEQGEGQWVVVRDFLPLYIDAWQETEKTPWNYATLDMDARFFQLSLPFCYGPTLKKTDLNEELLAVNLNMLYGKFTYNQRENIYALVYRVPGNAVRAKEIPIMIENLYYYAHMVFEVLKDEFALKRVSIEED